MTRNELMRRLQIKQDRERSARCRRLVRAINGVATKFHDDELGDIEAIVERAYGRVKLG